MSILINKQNNDKFKFKQMFLLQSGIIPLSFLPTSVLFCKDATHRVDFNLRLCKIRSHAMDLPEGVLAYYLLSCPILSDKQQALCRATFMYLTYDDMKKHHTTTNIITRHHHGV